MFRFALYATSIALVALACQPAPPGAPREADFESRVLSIDLSRAMACSTAEQSGELSPPSEGGLAYEIHEVNGRAGEILIASMTSASMPSWLLFGTGEGQTLTVLDSERSEGTAEIAMELPDDGRYFLVTASNQPGTYSLSVSTRTVPTFDLGGDPAHSYALIASIEDYPRERVDLEGPHQDAQLVRDMLVETFGFAPERVIVLEDEEVTRRGLTEAWLGHLRHAGPEGMALFYFSGHGIQIDQRGDASVPEEDRKDEALLLADGSVLVDHELGHLADGLRAGRTMIVLDNCYSGTGTRGVQGGAMKRAFVEKLDFPLRLPDRVFGEGATKSVDDDPSTYVLLAASAEDEVAWITRHQPEATAPSPVSVFTWYLVDELSTLSTTATFDDVMQSVRRRTLNFVRRNFGDNQSPHLEGNAIEGAFAAYLASSRE